jgi:hydroxymethylpyrimidine/phosphomethylpyrimidine kinase
MAETNHCVLSIAGFDPSGGAGILADIKTFEAHKVRGMGVLSALTIQNDSTFENLVWLDSDDILKQIRILTKKFLFPVVKIGLIEDLETLKIIITECKHSLPECSIIWDPIVKASAGFGFHNYFKGSHLFPVLEDCYLITPNINEAIFLTGITNPMQAAKELSKYCNVLLKGGHNRETPGTDYLFSRGMVETINPVLSEIYPKHGSGCVLSASIASNLVMGHDLKTSCADAKKYIEHFLSSNHTLLGTHYVQ